MNMDAFAILISGIALGTTACWAFDAWLTLRARVHYVRRFFAGADKLREMSAPEEAQDFVFHLAHAINDRAVAKRFVRGNLTSRFDTSPLWEELNEEQRVVFSHTLLSFNMAVSYRAGKNGRKFRTKILDRFTDRRVIESEVAAIKKVIADCPAMAA